MKEGLGSQKPSWREQVLIQALKRRHEQFEELGDEGMLSRVPKLRYKVRRMRCETQVGT